MKKPKKLYLDDDLEYHDNEQDLLYSSLNSLEE